MLIKYIIAMIIPIIILIAVGAVGMYIYKRKSSSKDVKAGKSLEDIHSNPRED